MGKPDYRKKITVCLGLVITLVLMVILLSYKKKDVLEVYDRNGELFYRVEGSDNLYRTWEEDGVTNVYTPAYYDIGKIVCREGDIE